MSTPLDTTQPKVPVVEKIIWTFTGNIQEQGNIRYDDTVPYDTVNAPDMKYCNFDPRLPGGDGMTLAPAYDQFLAGESGLVLPAGETSCLISKSATVDPPTSPPANPPTGHLARVRLLGSRRLEGLPVGR